MGFSLAHLKSSFQFCRIFLKKIKPNYIVFHKYGLYFINLPCSNPNWIPNPIDVELIDTPFMCRFNLTIGLSREVEEKKELGVMSLILITW